jgi:RNA 2',3'-cyclic 3'-phosphodiesterase
MQTERLFLGVDLDDPTRAALSRYLAGMAPGGLPGRTVPSPSWHLTLRFLGDTASDQRDNLIAGLEAMPRGAAFEATFSRPGAFPRAARASVLWIGVDAGAGELARLAAACEAVARGAGFPAEEKRFTPHLTLSRLRTPADLAPLVQHAPSAEVRFQVREITLFRSRLGAGPARYEPVVRWPLAAR